MNFIWDLEEFMNVKGKYHVKTNRFQKNLQIDVLTIWVYNQNMKFEWDEKKNQHNIQKHGFDFIDADKIFDEPYLVFEDDRRDYGEIRFIIAGWLNSRMVVLVYTKRKEIYRIISLRKANEREKKKFQDRLETR